MVVKYTSIKDHKVGTEVRLKNGTIAKIVKDPSGIKRLRFIKRH